MIKGRDKRTMSTRISRMKRTRRKKRRCRIQDPSAFVARLDHLMLISQSRQQSSPPDKNRREMLEWKPTSKNPILAM
jgi:hypothetical protein